MSGWDLNDIPQALIEAVTATGLGFVGAFARAAAAGDDKPMLRPALLWRVLGDGGMGLGLWLLMKSMGIEGWWVMFAAWAGGALGYAVVHDLALRVLKRKLEL